MLLISKVCNEGPLTPTHSMSARVSERLQTVLPGYEIFEISGQHAVLCNLASKQIVKAISLQHSKPFLERLPLTAMPMEDADRPSSPP